MARMDVGSADVSGFASSLDSGEAYFELGLMYAAGRQVELDLVAAHKWLNVAVFKGCFEAAARRAELAAEMSADEVKAALREARLFLTLH
ncbi:MAG: sel1 repeat family protein [Salinarimonadaceae bacterium]|nr:MAG: sel1 repeat family protein [Salinarimonadaceae bacterium]